ncbi:MAG: ATP/GTP-binding protein [Candidatus Bathyarchaeia archaeon]
MRGREAQGEAILPHQKIQGLLRRGGHQAQSKSRIHKSGIRGLSLEMRTYKIVVTGPFNAGKTTLIRTLCGKILESDRRLLVETVKQTTTVALDFGLLEVDDKRVRLFGTPGQRRFFFMWRVLAKGMDGYILMVDSQDPKSLVDAAFIYDYFRRNFPDKPHVIAANKADGGNIIPEKVMRHALKASLEIPVIPTIALDRESAMNLLRFLLGMIKP